MDKFLLSSPLSSEEIAIVKILTAIKNLLETMGSIAACLLILLPLQYWGKSIHLFLNVFYLCSSYVLIGNAITYMIFLKFKSVIKKSFYNWILIILFGIILIILEHLLKFSLYLFENMQILFLSSLLFYSVCFWFFKDNLRNILKSKAINHTINIFNPPNFKIISNKLPFPIFWLILQFKIAIREHKLQKFYILFLLLFIFIKIIFYKNGSKTLLILTLITTILWNPFHLLAPIHQVFNFIKKPNFLFNSKMALLIPKPLWQINLVSYIGSINLLYIVIILNYCFVGMKQAFIIAGWTFLAILNIVIFTPSRAIQKNMNWKNQYTVYSFKETFKMICFAFVFLGLLLVFASYYSISVITLFGGVQHK